MEEKREAWARSRVSSGPVPAVTSTLGTLLLQAGSTLDAGSFIPDVISSRLQMEKQNENKAGVCSACIKSQ